MQTEHRRRDIVHHTQNHGWHPHVKQVLSHFDIVFKWNVFSKLDRVYVRWKFSQYVQISNLLRKRETARSLFLLLTLLHAAASGYLTETTISVFPPPNCPRFADRLHKGFDRAVVVCHATILCSSNPYSPVGGMEEVNSSWVFLCKVWQSVLNSAPT